MTNHALIFSDHRGDERFFLRFRGTDHEMQLWLERYNTVWTEENASWSSLRWHELPATVQD
jgi:hypothetical protein